jgi:hydrogenase nickel incorporation protein HypA/HybF
MQVIETVAGIAKQNGLSRIRTLVLQIGELSSTIPRYVEACYPAAVDGTLLHDTQLKIEIIPGTGRCRRCGHVFNIVANNRACPRCSSEDWEIIQGKEFLIKEIIAC